MRLSSFQGLAILAVLSGPSLAQGKLDRPDPGIGEGLATAMAEGFMQTFGVSRAEADCLVYEVTMKAKATGHSKTPDEYAKDLLPLCKE